ncbi:hypothetical protein KBY96_15120 [Cyanobium sp. ATX 6A2]|uniref:hypothetical protein n=1 Tax=Cyanobium sp. ATX 6A2 TaxID=2823700 RepID=UPI0020CF40BA|nr:hypothetical protein [Cyanobium sp. ATX 6A2]MCP9889251.1 hypothetical protein [Cyanobium sp. ATX 6A2]
MSAEQFTRPLCNPQQLRRITKILRNHGFGLHVIVFIRPQLEYMNSRYVHTLRRLYHCLDFGDYVNQSLGVATGDIYDYNKFFQPLLQSGVPCTFIPFSRRYGDPFLQLIDALKINPDLQYSPAAPGSENVQPGTKGVWLSRLVVERIQALGFNGRTLKNTSQMVRSVAEKEGWHEDRYFGFSQQLAEKTINHYRAGNDAFALRAWNLPWEEVFSTEIPPQSIYTPLNGNESDRMNRLAEQIVARLATTNSQLSVALNATA